MLGAMDGTWWTGMPPGAAARRVRSDRVVDRCSTVQHPLASCAPSVASNRDGGATSARTAWANAGMVPQARAYTRIPRRSSSTRPASLTLRRCPLTAGWLMGKRSTSSQTQNSRRRNSDGSCRRVSSLGVRRRSDARDTAVLTAA